MARTIPKGHPSEKRQARVRLHGSPPNLKQGNDFLHHEPSGLLGVVAEPRGAPDDEGVAVVAEVNVGELGLEVLLHEAARQPFGPIRPEGPDDILRIDPEPRQGEPQIEQVPTLGALVQGPHLSRAELLDLEHRDFRPPLVPRALDDHPPRRQRQHRGTLERVDLELDLALDPGRRHEPPEHLGMLRHLGSDLVPQAPAHLRQPLHDVADAAGARPDVVEVLAVAAGRVQVELVEGGAAANDELPAEQVVVRDLADGMGEKQILLDLVGVGPGMLDRPCGHDACRYHRSGSTSLFRMMFQRGSRAPAFGDAGER